MLTLAHAGRPPAPHDVWSAWGLDPLVLGGLVAAVWIHHRVSSRLPPGRRVSSAVAISAVAIALVSPIDAMSDALASAHMIQHLLLTAVAAPLVALARPFEALVSGSTVATRRRIGRLRRTLGLVPALTARLRRPGIALLLHVAAVWLWHSSVAYQAAVEVEAIHAIEHLTFLGTAWWFWSVTLRDHGPGRVGRGHAVLLVFALAMTNVLLAVLLTFSDTAWYPVYQSTAVDWGLTPLADQQLAGVIMWVPGGLLHTAAALALVAAWMKGDEARAASPSTTSR